MNKNSVRRVATAKQSAKNKIMNKKSGNNLSRVQNLTMNSGIGPIKGVATSYSRKITTVQPKIGRSAKSFRVKHRELVLASINGASTFTVQSVIQLNPGLPATFPWLAPQAGQWEQYIVHKLHAIYTPLVATSTAGTLTLSPDYDASDPTPTTETQLSDNYDTVEDSIWQDIECVLDLAGMMGGVARKFVRPCAIAGDIKTFDVGKLFVATNNGAANPMGKLWLDYDFEFFVPQNSPSPATVPQQTSFFTQAATETWINTTPKAIVWDSLIFDPLGIGAPSSGVFTPPAGCYKIECSATFADSGTEAFAADMYLYKNGAALSKTVESNFDLASVANCVSNCSFSAVLPMNGTDTFQIQVTLFGSAGTLTTNQAQLTVSLA